MSVVRADAAQRTGGGTRLQTTWHRWAARSALLVGALALAERHTRAWLAALGETGAAHPRARAMQTLAYLLASPGSPEAWAQAAVWLERATELQPQAASAWFNLAYLRQQTAQHAAALVALHQALALDPQHDRAWYGLGLSLLALDQPAAALEAFQANTRLQPHSPHGWVGCARAQCRLGDGSGARATLEHLRAFEPRAARELERELER